MFNHGEYWAAHESLESAWGNSQGEDRRRLQGVIQAAAAFHKLIVQGNPAGAARLAARSLAQIDPAAGPLVHLDISHLAAELTAWTDRFATHRDATGPPAGLPRLEWSRDHADHALHVTGVNLFELAAGSETAPGTILIQVMAEGLQGWGEAPLAWEPTAAWDVLTRRLVPLLLAAPVTAPSEVQVLWRDVSSNLAPLAGLESALWELYCNRHQASLADALGTSSGPVRAALQVSPPAPEPDGDWHAPFRDVAQEARRRGFGALVAPVSPNAAQSIDWRQWSAGDMRVCLDCGGRFRRQHRDALLSLAGTTPGRIHQPFPYLDVVRSAGLRRAIAVPVSQGGFRALHEVDTLHRGGAFDHVCVEPELSGLTEALAILDYCHERRIPAWVRTDARTGAGLLAACALGGHPAAGEVCLPDHADLAAIGVEPAASGHLVVPGGPGIGWRPDPQWLAASTLRTSRFSAL